MVTTYSTFQAPSGAPFGLMRLTWVNDELKALEFSTPSLMDDMGAPTPAMVQAQLWLDAYFRADQSPALPRVRAQGSAFQHKVWAELRRIPWGTCITYAELAQRVGSAPRAVGGALRANPLPILIPCHRVIAAAGLGGYAGPSEQGQARKRWLLEHEAALPSQQPVGLEIRGAALSFRALCSLPEES